jgi:ketosteroid isomerase-like protein
MSWWLKVEVLRNFELQPRTDLNGQNPYKTKQKIVINFVIWQLNNFSIDDDIGNDSGEATKAYTLKENFYTVNIDTNRILNEVRPLAEDLIQYSETAQLDSFLRCYAETPDFLAVSADGIIRNYQDFKKICKDYYGSLKEQKIATTHEIFHVLDDITVVLCWSGYIDAFFNNGDVMKMQNYTVTFLYKKIGGEWKVIHSHESALPPQIIKSK